jgi:hypothetical protein
MRCHGWTISLFLVAGILELGCERKHPNFTPPPLPQPQQTVVPANPELPPPPDIPVQPGQPAVEFPSPRAEVPPPPVSPSRPRRSPAASPAIETSPSNTGAPAPPLRLGPMTTPEQEHDLNGQIDQMLSNAEATLNTFQGRALTRDQETAVAQVKSFIRQARDRRKSDLPGARSLAQRAEILSRDLAASTR